MNNSICYFSGCKTERNNRTLKNKTKDYNNETFVKTLKKIVLDEDKAYKNAIYLR